MKMRWGAAMAAAVILALGTAPARAQEGHGPRGANARPNIILVLTDDLDLELGTVDSMETLRTQVAQKGITFSGFLVPLSLCCPSRTTILRGQFPHNHQVLTNKPPAGGFEKAYELGLEGATIATALQASGYRTVLLGKYLNGYPIEGHESYVPPGWTEWYSPAAGRAYGAYDYTMNENGTLVEYGSDPHDYITDVISAKAVGFILRNAQVGAPPFFIYASTFAPHSPCTPAPRHSDLFPGAQAPRPPSFNEADVSDKPAYIRSKDLLTEDEMAQLDRIHHMRMQALQAVDEMIAALLAALESVGQLDNTYLFFTSDNGYHLGEHRLNAGKYTPYETDVRIPMFARGPGISEGVTTPALAGTVDLAPTFADLAGVQLSTDGDGRSLVDLLRSGAPASTWRNAFLLEDFKGLETLPSRQPDYFSYGISDREGVLEPPDQGDLAPTPNPSHFGFRAGSIKYVEYETGERELYLLDKDPFELENKASLADAEVLSSLASYLTTLKACAGSSCSSADSVVPPAPLSADFAYSPLDPTDMDTVSFTASARGTAPCTFAWDLAGQAATGPNASRRFDPGDPTVRLTVTDAIGAETTVTKALAVRASVSVAAVLKRTDPYRLKIKGAGFAPGCRALVDGRPAPETAYRSVTEVVAKKGGALKALTPKGVPVEIVVENPDGRRSLPFTFVAY